MTMFEILTSVYGGIALGQVSTPARPSAVAGAIRKLAHRLLVAFKERSYNRELDRLDDRMLRDIGLSRSEIPYVARTLAANDNAPRLAA